MFCLSKSSVHCKVFRCWRFREEGVDLDFLSGEFGGSGGVIGGVGRG